MKSDGFPRFLRLTTVVTMPFFLLSGQIEGQSFSPHSVFEGKYDVQGTETLMKDRNLKAKIEKTSKHAKVDKDSKVGKVSKSSKSYTNKSANKSQNTFSTRGKSVTCPLDPAAQETSVAVRSLEDMCVQSYGPWLAAFSIVTGVMLNLLGAGPICKLVLGCDDVDQAIVGAVTALVGGTEQLYDYHTCEEGGSKEDVKMLLSLVTKDKRLNIEALATQYVDMLTRYHSSIGDGMFIKPVMCELLEHHINRLQTIITGAYTDHGVSWQRYTYQSQMVITKHSWELLLIGYVGRGECASARGKQDVSLLSIRTPQGAYFRGQNAVTELTTYKGKLLDAQKEYKKEWSDVNKQNNWWRRCNVKKISSCGRWCGLCKGYKFAYDNEGCDNNDFLNHCTKGYQGHTCGDNDDHAKRNAFYGNCDAENQWHANYNAWEKNLNEVIKEIDEVEFMMSDAKIARLSNFKKRGECSSTECMDNCDKSYGPNVINYVGECTIPPFNETVCTDFSACKSCASKSGKEYADCLGLMSCYSGCTGDESEVKWVPETPGSVVGNFQWKYKWELVNYCDKRKNTDARTDNCNKHEGIDATFFKYLKFSYAILEGCTIAKSYWNLTLV